MDDKSLPQWSHHKMKSGLDVQRSACDERPVWTESMEIFSQSHRRNLVLRSVESAVLGVDFQVLLSV